LKVEERKYRRAGRREEWMEGGRELVSEMEGKHKGWGKSGGLFQYCSIPTGYTHQWLAQLPHAHPWYKQENTSKDDLNFLISNLKWCEPTSFI
jgi:hypothetical protein